MCSRHSLTRLLKVVSLLLLCLYSDARGQVTNFKDCVERFGAADEATLGTSIKGQPETAKVCVNWLLKAYVSSEVAGRSDDAQRSLVLADRLARAHAAVMNNQLLPLQVTLYRSWTPEQMREKTGADAQETEGLAARSDSGNDAALEIWRHALETFTRLGDEWERSDVLNVIALVLQSKGELQEALKLQNQSLEIRRGLGDLGATAENLTNIGTIYTQQKMTDKALEAHLQSLAIRREVKDVRGETITLVNVASLYSNLGEMEKGAEYYKQLLPIERKERFVAAPTLAEALTNMGEAFLNLRMRTEAQESYRQLGELMRTVGAPPHVVGQFSARTAAAYERAGLSEEALTYYKKAFDSYDGDEYLVERGDVLLSVGIIHKNRGRYIKAFETYYLALDYYQKAGSLRRAGEVFNNVGIVTDKLGMYGRSLEFYDAALHLYEKETQGHDLNALEQQLLKGDVANTLMNIGLTYFNTGQYDKSLEYFRRVAGMFERPDMFEILGSLELNTGVTYLRMARYEEAQAHFEKALAVFEKNSDQIGLANTLASLAEIHLRRREDAQARELLGRAMAIHQRLDNLKEVAALLNNLAASYHARADFAKALPLYRKALETSRLITDHEGSWRSSTGVAVCIEELGQPLEALKHYEEAVKDIESLRGGIGSGPSGIESRIGFFTTKLIAYERLVGLLMKLSEGGGEAAKEYRRRAFEYADRGKARGMLDLLARSSALTQIGAPSEPLKKLVDAQAQVVTYEDGLRRATAKPPAQRDEAMVAELRRGLEQASREERDAQRTLEESFPRFTELANPQPLTLKQVQDTLLKERQALVEYVVNSRAALAFVVTKSGLTTITLTTNANELADLVRSLRSSLTKGTEYDARAAHELYVRLFRPVEPYLGDAAAVYVVPDGPLHYVPFEALLTSADPERRASSYLLDKYEFAYVPSAGVLRTAREDERGRTMGSTPRQPLVVFADPVYASNTVDARTAAPAASASMLDDCRSLFFSRLPHTEEEAKSVARTLGVVFSGAAFNVRERASEARVKSMDLSAYRYVHFATHGLVCDRDEEGGVQLQPSLVLSQAGVSPEEARKGDEGFLQMNEILNLKLNADLVTLSACKTGLGERLEGEGLVGLTRSFMYAGTPSVLVSLWNVADKSTPIFMNRFYSNLRDGMKKGEALREAKRWMFENSSHVEVEDGYRNVVTHDHPYFWAPFVLVGANE